MDYNYVFVVLPESVMQILWMVLLVLGIAFYIYSWRTEKRKSEVVDRLKEVARRYEEALGIGEEESK